MKKFIHYSQELEQAVLGACLIEKLAFGRVYGSLDSDTFHFSGHQEVFGTMKEMYENSVPIDILTVIERLTSKGIGNLQGYDVPYFITSLTNHVVSSAHLEYHAHLVREMWRKRKLLALREMVKGEEPSEDINTLYEQINQITSGQIKREWYDMSEIMFGLMVHQSDMVSGKKTFITTGFKKADKLNGGFYNGQLIVIGARPSVGKSALMGQMALSIAKTGKNIGIISLEMNNTEIAARLASIETEIDFGRVFRDIANDENLHRKFYDKISKETVNLPIYLSDKTKVNVNEIKAKAVKLKAQNKLDCLMVDYLQLIDGSTDNRNYNREQEVAKMSRGLKLLAQELDIPVIVLCQLNRAVTNRAFKDRFPKLSDLRESGAIEQDADIVMFIHRDFMSGFEVDENGNSTEMQADLIVPKWRNGATFHLPLDFDPPKMRFSERLGFIPLEAPGHYQDANPF